MTSSLLDALCDHLPSLGLTALLLPRADAHQGENVVAAHERLGEVTGFSGSAGIACLLAKGQGALFVDGRYTLQAQTELTSPRLSPHPLEALDLWLAALPTDTRLGYDPWLHTDAQRAHIARALPPGAQLIPLPQNPVDALWTARPPLPKAPLWPHPAALAGEDAAAKLAWFAQALRDQGARGAVVCDLASIAWLFNLRGQDIPYAPLFLAWATWSADQGYALLLTDPDALPPKVATMLDSLGVRLHDYAHLLEHLPTQGPLLLDPATTPAAIHDALPPGTATLTPQPHPIMSRKSRKTAAEQEGARAAHLIDAVALCRFLHWLEAQPSEHLDELRAAQKLQELRAEHEHFVSPSFPSISGFGPHGAIVHYRATPASNRPFASGSLYLIDSGGQYPQGTTDVTRTLAIGPPTQGMRRDYTLVLKGHLALGDALFPQGTTGAHLDTLARAPLWRHGLDYAHGTGHGVGSFLSVHEGPARISKHPNEVPLAPGMILSNEPGLYRQDAYGIRIENLLLVTPHPTLPDMLKFETLTLAPYDRRLIDPTLLLAHEVDLVDVYHQEVWERVSPQLSPHPEATHWLRQATRPLAEKS